MLRQVPIERLPGGVDAGQGLAPSEVRLRFAHYGPNRVLEEAPSRWLQVLRDSVRDPMVWFLVGTAGVFAFVGQTGEALVLGGALVPLLGMDAWLHRRTQASVAGLSSRLATHATVLRATHPERIDAIDLVPGDLVVVRAGEPFPADGIVVHAGNAQVDESALTGEAFPVRKAACVPVPGPVEGEHWGFAGTRLLTGDVRLRVIYTGAETVYGQIVRSAIQGSHARTPLQSAVANLVTVLVVAAAIVCVALAWIRLRQGHGLVDALLSAVTLGVAALPEEFPVVLTFFLGVGVYRLAKRHALVRRAVVVENIGRVSSICSDKTGTLTEGRLELTHVLARDGLDADGLRALACVAARTESGDPLDAAILSGEPSRAAHARVTTFPFTEDRKRETGVVREHGGLLCVTKGAPEIVLPMCDIDAAGRARWLERVDEYAAGGHKVIACASRVIDETAWSGGEPDRGFTFDGLLCFEDPVREGVPEALRVCRDAGIHVIMVTGDHPATARAVAREIGLGGDEPCVMEADAVHARIDARDTGVLANVHVVARAVPGQKLGIVRALQERGEIVAVTGDGVNDVPALQAADIGIAMGERGTRSAREVAAIVLLDDNFSNVVRAIAEGRQLFANLRLSFLYLLMIHLPLVITAALIPLAGYPLLYLPVHIVWLELIIHPTALLVFQETPGATRLMPLARTSRPRFFSAFQWALIVATGVAVTATIMMSYLRSLGMDGNTEHARAMALMVLLLSSAAITLGLTAARTRAGWRMAGATLASALVLVQIPPLARLLHLAPLHGHDWWPALVGAGLAGVLAFASRRDRAVAVDATAASGASA
ncbi:MAG: HAD-IC family P-type ATPase [Betaproteobacteria bacterium]|nr:HAD-IC family P-type ATPase [Betaproteobacteria bacterium]